ncbi:MAG: hypothetical protein AMXMBFR64_14270 [Myxococcales bacterium]
MAQVHKGGPPLVEAGRALLSPFGAAWTLALAATLTAMTWVFFVAPTERTMGIVQKIFYFHVPFAIAMGVLFVLTSVLSLAYLLKSDDRVDAAAAACAEVAVLFGVIVLVSGPLWARKAWGAYWSWEPRLTLTLLTVFIYIGYLTVRGFAGERGFARRVAAGLGLIGAPAWYLIHIAVERWGGTHPKDVVYGESGGLQHPDMRTTFFLGLVAVLLLAVVTIWTRIKVRRLEDRIEALALDMEANAIQGEH